MVGKVGYMSSPQSHQLVGDYRGALSAMQSSVGVLVVARRDPWVVDAEVGVVDGEAAAGVVETEAIAGVMDVVVGVDDAEAGVEVCRVFGVDDAVSLKAEFADPEREADEAVSIAEVVENLKALGLETDEAVSVKAEEAVSVIEAVEASLGTEAEVCTPFEADIAEPVEAEDAAFTPALVGSDFVLPVVVPKVLLVEASNPEIVLRSIEPVWGVSEIAVREPLAAEAEVTAISARSELGLYVRVRKLLLPVEKLDAEAALRVAESVAGGSEKEYGVRGHAELVELVEHADDTVDDIVPLDAGNLSRRVNENVYGVSGQGELELTVLLDVDEDEEDVPDECTFVLLGSIPDEDLVSSGSESGGFSGGTRSGPGSGPGPPPSAIQSQHLEAAEVLQSVAWLLSMRFQKPIASRSLSVLAIYGALGGPH
ncbi:hypothetical protein OEA41_003463 [Lepraria neglecta]|uniref:Uncharacterized protein n=1 Tax=Lepraria neglecta TaxID=209136 RepID=A0AAD9Z4L7_9LECA|nr:hypothetical protein OEA41_003463 [Lepraria neglecta]